jgi:hypothetical protein
MAGRAAAAALQPARIGFLSLIALVSSLLPALAATRAIGQASGVTVVAVMLIVPLWAVTVTEWPIGLRRVQAAIALLIGLVGVGLAAAFTPVQIGDIGEAHRTAELILTFFAATALRVVPTRRIPQRG